MVTEVIDLPVDEAIICEEAHLGFDCLWGIVYMVKKQEWAEHGSLWDSRISSGGIRGGALHDHLHAAFPEEAAEPGVAGVGNAAAGQFVELAIMGHSV